MTITLPLLGAMAVSAGFTWLLVAALLPLLRRGWLDPITPRSSHSTPTPRGGGVAFVVVGGFALILFGTGPIREMAPLVLPLAAVGWLDDRSGLPVAWRYLVQLVTAALLLALSPWGVSLWLLPLLLVAVTAVINFTNFMDGLDGLVASCCALQFLVAAVALQAPALALLAAALLGFLLWNWSPAKVFMGDVGSTYLGAVVSAVVLQAPTPSQGLGLLLVAAPLLADPTSCVLRRAWAGHRLAQAHRLHLYQRLQQAGWSHRQVALLYAAATAGCGAALLAAGLPGVLVAAVFAVVLGLWLDQRVALPFAAAAGGP